MTGFVARVALACALFLAVPSAPGFAMGLFDGNGSLHQRSAQDVHDTPEIDPGAAQGAVAIVIAGLLLLTDRRRR
jgi:hypothetical protein